MEQAEEQFELKSGISTNFFSSATRKRMLLGVGVDLLSLTRFRALVARRGAERVANRILHKTELSEYTRIPTNLRTNYLALRWSAKEATFKALYPSLSVNWKQVLVQKHRNKPEITLDLIANFASNIETKKVDQEPALARSSIKLHLSVSHDADLLVAYVVAEHVSRITDSQLIAC